MKIIQRKAFYVFSLVLLFLSCEKWDLDRISFPEVLTLEYDAVELAETFSQTTLKGKITGIVEGERIDNHGHIWVSGTEVPFLENGQNEGKTSLGSRDSFPLEFNSLLQNLSPEKVYTYRAYGILPNGETLYGDPMSFTTPALGFQLVSELVLEPLTGYILTPAGPKIEVRTTIEGLPKDINIKEVGIVWHTQPKPEQGGIVSPHGNIISSATTSYMNTLRNIEPGTTYYIKPYLIQEDKTVVHYGAPIIYTFNNFWTRKNDFSDGTISLAGAFVIHNTGYAIGGESLTDQFEYDPEADRWQEISQEGLLKRFDAISFVIGDTAYYGAGPGKSDFWKFDRANQTWDTIPRPQSSPSGRRYGWSFVLDGKGYMGGGENRGVINDFWEYNPATGKWTSLGPLGADVNSPAPRVRATTFVIGDTAYLGPGSGGRDFWSFSSQSGWTKNNLAQLPNNSGITEFYVGFSANGKGYFALGGPCFCPASFNKRLWQYSSRTNEWQEKAPFPGIGRLGPEIMVLNNRAYLGNGFSEGFLGDWWEYIPE